MSEAVNPTTSPNVERPTETRAARVLRVAPPFVSMAAGLALAVVAVHVVVSGVVVPSLGWDLPALTVPVLDVIVFAGCAGYGWLRRAGDAHAPEADRWRLWDDPVGTLGLAVCLALATAVLVGLAVTSPAVWAALAVAAIVVAVVGAFGTGPRSERDLAPVVLRGEQPDRPEDYLHVDLPCSLEPAVTGAEQSIGLWIRTSELDRLRRSNPVTKHGVGGPQFEHYVVTGTCDEINVLADRLAAIAVQRGLDRYLEVVLVLNLVQQIPYAFDKDSTGFEDYWRYPLETVADGCGDCEDTSILAVALLSAMGHETCFLHMPGHVAIGVSGLPEATGVSFEGSDGKRYYYVETTDDGWQIGVLPDGRTPGQVTITAIVSPLRARRPEPALIPGPAGRWAMLGRLQTRWSLAVAVFGGAVGAALALVSS